MENGPVTKRLHEKKRVDQKEFDLPETVYIHDIDNQAIQNIVAQILSRIPGVHLSHESLMESFLGKKSLSSTKGIHVEQDPKAKCVKIRIELVVDYGISIPEISQAIYDEVAKEVPELTGLPISQIHLLYKDVRTPKSEYSSLEKTSSSDSKSEYNDSF